MRRLGFISTVCTYSALALTLQAATMVVGTPRATSSAWEGPETVSYTHLGALKNVIALAAGISDGLKLGDNAKAALMTRGLSEIARLGVAMGGRSETFAGLTGVGDLIVTCTSMHSRNRRCGLLIGQGMAATDAIKQIGMTVEGYTATLVARELSLQAGVEMPIVEQMFQVLYNGLDCRQGIKKDVYKRQLLHRPGEGGRRAGRDHHGQLLFYDGGHRARCV